ncbi:hypothetical protein ACLBWS_17885 [Brucellaceae bacterium D45D]
MIPAAVAAESKRMQRTTVSKIAYCLTVLVAFGIAIYMHFLTVKSVFRWFNVGFTFSEIAINANTIAMELVSPLPLAFIAFALLFRSGATIWLVSLYWLVIALPTAAFCWFLDRPIAPFMAVAGVVVPLALVLLLLSWLVKKGELRKP